MTLYRETFKGRYIPKNPNKYSGDPTNIIYRSSWELRFMKYCDTNPSVVRWSSEEHIVPYRCKTDGKVHRYFVDFKVEVKQADGSIKHLLVEIKPKKFVQEPKIPQRKTRRYVEEVLQYAKNVSKWEAAKAFAEKRGWEFVILTEDHLL